MSSDHYLATGLTVQHDPAHGEMTDPNRYDPESGFLTQNGCIHMPISGRQFASCMRFLESTLTEYQTTTIRIDDHGMAKLLGPRNSALPGIVRDPRTGKVSSIHPQST